MRNAFEAIAPHESISCVITDGMTPDRVCIQIHNGGHPIPLELLPHLATPFCSTKPSGTGLGLAISKGIVIAHNGELEITSSSSGTTVSVHLPMLSATAETEMLKYAPDSTMPAAE
ncbi:ATP-binding protein [Stenomitos frigidus]|uniref:ATP-binding protein n=1 Tax=Stenomitos frigidus TaxID=1886765 RepID=UPI001FE89C38|nr:ATP-binding protein [Stenomitos frigidus]